jgi:hypothetical protein
MSLIMFAKWAKPKLRFWRIFQMSTCYMIPLQTRVAHNTLIMLISVFWTNSANVLWKKWDFFNTSNFFGGID